MRTIAGILEVLGFEKTAGKVSRMMRAGLLSQEGIERARSIGAIRPASVFDEGLTRGNLAIARKYGLGKDVEDVLQDPERILAGNYSTFHMTDDGRRVLTVPATVDPVGTSSPNLPGGTGATQFYEVPAASPYGAGVLRRMYGRTKDVVSNTKQLAEDPVGTLTRALSFHRPTDAERRLLEDDVLGAMGPGAHALRSLFNRHELNEMRAALKYARRHPNTAPEQFPLFYSHRSPDILIEEGRDVQGLGRDAIEYLKKMRGGALGRVAGNGPSEREFMTKYFPDQYPRNLQSQPGLIANKLGALVSALKERGIPVPPKRIADDLKTYE